MVNSPPVSATDAEKIGTLNQPVESFDGVGDARAKQLRELGIETLFDLLHYFPRDYQFESSELAISALQPEIIQNVRGTVVAVNYIPARPRPRFEATIDDGTGRCALVWFNGGYLRSRIHPGKHLRVKGKVRFFRNLPQIGNPHWEVIDDQAQVIDQSKFRAIYPASSKLSSDQIGKIVEKNIETGVHRIEEWFDPALVQSRDLLSRQEAYRLIHLPADFRQAMNARRRLVYDELMLMQIGLQLGKRVRDGRLSAPVLRVDKLLDQRICNRFKFSLTNAQRQATYDIVRDLQSGQPMNRLLQGDVGSGKTSVAVYAMLAAVANKTQAALLAPTEVLAEQHYLTLSNLLRDSHVTIELFTGRTKRQSRGTLAKALADGRIHIAVGTQALIQRDIEFANLGLVVVDEQHRLGVKQRAVLRDKGLSPHYLVMTATPIPRTLALSYFADFDLSVIDELPPGRQPIETRWIQPSDASKAHDFIIRQVKEGRQAYYVLPRIEDDGMEETKSVIKEFDRLSKGPLKSLRLGILHGQLSTDEKAAVMQQFRDGLVDVLIATTVIEVGIDVPNATVMVIDNAGQFGLSQLHQLRGRVGRGSEHSYCLLIAEKTANSQRLEAMVATSDGFKIAEMDLQLRGPGEFFGTRQHGLPEFRLADLTQEMSLLHQAREDAITLLQNDPNLRAHAALREAVQQQFADTLELSAVG